jgi:hypothetical protein
MWYVFLQDTNGCRRFVGAPFVFADEVAAQSRMEEIKAPHNKPHKVDYWVVYAPSYAAVVAEYEIVT